jgi:16S rRNA processing protein RimM
MSTAPEEETVAVGRVLAPSGVKGEIKIEPLTDVAQLFSPGRRLWLKGEPFQVEGVTRRKGQLHLKLSGVDSREAAEALRGETVSLPRELLEPLPEGSYYRFQIVGMQVYDVERGHLGEIRQVITTGGNDVYVVEGERGEVLLPAIEDVIREVDVAGGRMTVELMEGMLPEKRLP